MGWRGCGINSDFVWKNTKGDEEEEMAFIKVKTVKHLFLIKHKENVQIWDFIDH